MPNFTSIIPPLTRTLALCNTSTLFFRPWITRQPKRIKSYPNTIVLSALYALLQTSCLALFYHSGLAQDAWLPVLFCSAWHICASEICLLFLTGASRERRTHSKVTWEFSRTKLIFALPISSAAATDAALILLAGRFDKTWEEPDTLRFGLRMAALPLYCLSLWGDRNLLLHAAGLPLFSSSCRDMSRIAVNITVLLAGKLAWSWLVQTCCGLPMLELIACTNGDLVLSSRDKFMQKWADGEASSWQIGSQLLQIVLTGLAGLLLAFGRNVLTIEELNA